MVSFLLLLNVTCVFIQGTLSLLYLVLLKIPQPVEPVTVSLGHESTEMLRGGLWNTARSKGNPALCCSAWAPSQGLPLGSR